MSDPTVDDAGAAANGWCNPASVSCNWLTESRTWSLKPAAAFQTIAHALGLALHNAVARQQHSAMLRNALTTAAATALLDGRTEQAEAVLKLADSRLVNPTFDAEVGQLQGAVSQLREELEKILAAASGQPAAPKNG